MEVRPFFFEGILEIRYRLGRRLIRREKRPVILIDRLRVFDLAQKLRDAARFDQEGKDALLLVLVHVLHTALHVLVLLRLGFFGRLQLELGIRDIRLVLGNIRL